MPEFEFGDNVEIVGDLYTGHVGTIEEYYPAGLYYPVAVYIVKYGEFTKGMFLGSELKKIEVDSESN